MIASTRTARTKAALSFEILCGPAATLRHPQLRQTCDANIRRIGLRRKAPREHRGKCGGRARQARGNSPGVCGRCPQPSLAAAAAHCPAQAFESGNDGGHHKRSKTPATNWSASMMAGAMAAFPPLVRGNRCFAEQVRGAAPRPDSVPCRSSAEEGAASAELVSAGRWLRVHVWCPRARGRGRSPRACGRLRQPLAAPQALCSDSLAHARGPAGL